MATNFYFQKVTDVSPIDIEATFNVRVTQVRGLNPPSPKELFTRDWANENGIDVYLPPSRFTKATDVTITFFAESTDTKTAIELYDDITAYMIGAEFDYWDTLQNKKVNLIYTDNKPEWYQFITPQKVMFEITLLNKTGVRTNVQEVVTVPSVTTLDAGLITSTSVSVGITMDSHNGGIITLFGIYIAELAVNLDAANADFKTESAGNISEGYSAQGIVLGLTSNTLYYYRAFADNEAGVGYGATKSFTTLT